MITQGMCTSAKEEFFRGVHQPGDMYMLALYNEVAGLGPATCKYDPEDEVYGKGYTSGGKEIKGFATGTVNGVAYLTWSEPVIWTNSSLSAPGGLVYNKSKNNRAICAFDFGDLISSKNGNFIVSLPPKGAGALILWG